MAREKARSFSFFENGKVAFIKYVISTSFKGTLILVTDSISEKCRQVGISGSEENVPRELNSRLAWLLDPLWSGQCPGSYLLLFPPYIVECLLDIRDKEEKGEEEEK